MAGGGGADSGQAAEKADESWLSWGAGLITGGFEGMERDGNSAAASVVDGMAAIGGRAAENARKIVTDGALGEYPGYGSLWAYDGGVQVKPKGWAVLGAAAVALFLVLKG